MEEKKEKMEHLERIGALKRAGYSDGEIAEMEHEDDYIFYETAHYAMQGHTKANIEGNFEKLERKHMKEAGLSDAAIDKWQKEGVIDHDL